MGSIGALASGYQGWGEVSHWARKKPCICRESSWRDVSNCRAPDQLRVCMYVAGGLAAAGGLVPSSVDLASTTNAVRERKMIICADLATALEIPITHWRNLP